MTELVRYFQFHAAYEILVYATIGDGPHGVRHAIQSSWTRADLVAYIALYPDVCGNTNAMLAITCIAKAGAGMCVGIDIGFHAHTTLAQLTQSSNLLACHIGKRQYQQETTSQRYVTRAPLGNVTTQFMGVTRVDPM